MTSPGPAAARDLEQQAQALDILTLTAATAREHVRRRLLLADLAAAGLLAAPAPAGLRAELSRLHCPALIGYLDAAAGLAAYADSAARRSAGLPGPPRVSLDWFRLGSPIPAGHDPHAWLASWEQALADTAAAPAQAGHLLIRTDSWYRLEWRRDDGQSPLLLRVAPAR